jgi:hypothetical protein
MERTPGLSLLFLAQALQSKRALCTCQFGVWGCIEGKMGKASAWEILFWQLEMVRRTIDERSRKSEKQ